MTGAPSECPHLRVDAPAEPKRVKGPPTPEAHLRQSGYHLAQGGICRACGAPVLRVTEHVKLGPWRAVGEPDPVQVRQTRAA